MTDPPKPRRKVTGQIAISSPSTSTSSSSTARVRAKVDVSSLPGPSTPSTARSATTATTTTPNGRPGLRSTPSSASLRSGVSTTSSRARSPAPPLPSPPVPTGFLGSSGRATPSSRPVLKAATSSSSSLHSTPVAATRRAPTSGRSSPTKEQTPGTARIRSSAVTQNAFGAGARTPIRGTGLDVGSEGSGRRPVSRTSDVDTGNTNGPKIRAKITQPPTPVTSGVGGRFPPLLTPTGLDGHVLPPATVPASPLLSPPPIDPPAALQSPSYAQHAIMAQYQPHPTASAPGSPLHTATPLSLQRSASIKAKQRKPLPYNPATHPPSLPPAPLSPELRTVDLPLMTPTRSREDESRRPSLSGRHDYHSPHGVLLHFDRVERDGLGGATVVTMSDAGMETRSEGGKEPVNGDQAGGVEGADGTDAAASEIEEQVKEARVNRKIADLEITNASLLAINRSLEATKSKQRSEIMKLRRMLRESFAGNKPGLMPVIPSYLSTPDISDLDRQDGEEEDDEEMRNPELDARWDKIAEMVDRMNLRAATAVERGKEEIKVAPGRVLDWTEIEGFNCSITSMTGTPEPERVAEAD